MPRYLFVRLSEQDKESVVRLAKELGLTQSALLRMLLRAGRVLWAQAQKGKEDVN
ncbi:MAG: ribbon-helix-helix protein, CopG family [Chloroflexota bacterium]